MVREESYDNILPTSNKSGCKSAKRLIIGANPKRDLAVSGDIGGSLIQPKQALSQNRSQKKLEVNQ